MFILPLNYSGYEAEKRPRHLPHSQLKNIFHSTRVTLCLIPFFPIPRIRSFPLFLSFFRRRFVSIHKNPRRSRTDTKIFVFFIKFRSIRIAQVRGKKKSTRKSYLGWIDVFSTEIWIRIVRTRQRAGGNIVSLVDLFTHASTLAWASALWYVDLSDLCTHECSSTWIRVHCWDIA